MFCASEGGVDVVEGEADVLVGPFVEVVEVGDLWEARYTGYVIDGVYVRGVWCVRAWTESILLL